MWHGAPLDDFLEPSTTLRVQFLRHLGPIDLNKGHCTTFLGAADFFCVLVHGLSGTRRAQTFFPVHCEPNATPGKTHGRHRGSPGPRTFSHFFNLILEGVYFYLGRGKRGRRLLVGSHLQVGPQPRGQRPSVRSRERGQACGDRALTDGLNGPAHLMSRCILFSAASSSSALHIESCHAQVAVGRVGDARGGRWRHAWRKARIRGAPAGGPRQVPGETM